MAASKVVSVGNITSGGSGKTPFCIYLAELLRDTGLRVAISHRGYKGSFEKFPTLISEHGAILNTVKDAGDEAYLIASRLPGIPVVVGKQRVAAVSLILAKNPETQVVILDDGFQHLKIHRDLDIVCFDSDTGVGNGLLLPAGYLREPLETVAYSCLAVVIHKSSNSDPQALNGLLSGRTPHIFHCFNQGTIYIPASGDIVSASELTGKGIALISGIANPLSFEKTVKEMGISFTKHFSYPDHYHFDDESVINDVAEYCQTHSVDHLLCTEKDIAKLNRYPWLSDRLLVLRIELTCTEADNLKALMLERIGD